jgi:type I restriction enzyme M protein
VVNFGENGRVTLAELEAHLWESANILRGPIDQADFKSYVFPLLFLKRVSDVYDEEFQQALDESDGDVDYASFAENHRFQVPESAHWNDLRTRTENVGQAIQQAMRTIEQANPNKLYGIFGDTQWTNKERLPDSLLRDLIDHFSKLPLGNTRVEPDVLGNAYEFLIKKFADLTNKKAGEFYTPRSVVRMLVNILDPHEGETVYDPACGTGGMLIEVVQHVRGRGGRVQLLWGKVFGQEKNLTTAAIARMNLFLHGVEDFSVVRGDTLRDPAFFVGDELATFDCVIANPPFSLEKWGEDVWASDRFGRNFAGMPPRRSGDYAWVEHMVKSMAAKTGRLAVVLPQSALFRSGAEQRIRKYLLDADLIEAVVGLAPNLFYGTGVAACVMVLRQRKAPERRGKVLIVDASTLFKRGRNQVMGGTRN